jgi:hypothetical protein
MGVEEEAVVDEEEVAAVEGEAEVKVAVAEGGEEAKVKVAIAIAVGEAEAATHRRDVRRALPQKGQRRPR